MTASPIERIRPAFESTAARAFACMCLVAICGAVHGAAFGSSLVLNGLLWNSSHPQPMLSVVSSLAIAFLYGGMAGCIVGALTSPLPTLMMLRKSIRFCIVRITAITAGCFVLGTLLDPAIGFYGGIMIYFATCIIVPLFAPRVWPDVIPPPACTGCGYDLAGLDVDLCPECARKRPEPRHCRACDTPLDTPDQTAPGWEQLPRRCPSCRNYYPYLLNCQRCGHPLTTSAPTCPGCRRPTGLA